MDVEQMICIKCKSSLNWITVGYDQYGKIQMLGCDTCGWTQENDEMYDMIESKQKDKE